MLLYKETTLSRVYTSVMHFKKTLCGFQDRVVRSLASVRTTWYSVQTLIGQATSIRTSNCPKHHLARWRELSVRTFLCVKKLLTVPACIRPDISAARPEDTQCSTSYGISFQNTDMRRLLQPSGSAHPYSKLCIQNSNVRTTAIMVWMRELHIWKFRASNKPSEQPFPRSGRAKP